MPAPFGSAQDSSADEDSARGGSKLKQKLKALKPPPVTLQGVHDGPSKVTETRRHCMPLDGTLDIWVQVRNQTHSTTHMLLLSDVLRRHDMLLDGTVDIWVQAQNTHMSTLILWNGTLNAATLLLDITLQT